MVGWTLMFYSICLELLFGYLSFSLVASKYKLISDLANMAVDSGLLNSVIGKISSLKRQPTRYPILFIAMASYDIANIVVMLISCIIFPILSLWDVSLSTVQSSLLILAHFLSICIAVAVTLASRVHNVTNSAFIVIGANVGLVLIDSRLIPRVIVYLLGILCVSCTGLAIVRAGNYDPNFSFNMYVHNTPERLMIWTLVLIRLFVFSVSLFMASPSQFTAFTAKLVYNLMPICLSILSANLAVYYQQRAFECQNFCWKWRSFLLPAIPLGACDLLVTFIQLFTHPGATCMGYYLPVKSCDIFGLIKQFSFYGSSGVIGVYLYLSLVEIHSKNKKHPLVKPLPELC